MMVIEHRFLIVAEIPDKDADNYRSELRNSIEIVEERIKAFFDQVNKNPSLVDQQHGIRTEVQLQT